MSSIRRGHLVTTQGIGSIVTDKDNETFLILSSDTWVYLNRGPHIIDEPRLKKYLGVRTLIQPPPAEKQKGARGFDKIKEFVRTIRFPSWHFCPMKDCRTLQKIDFEQQVGACRNPGCNNRRGLTPVRFLSVCENGHIDDFPFQEWVHRGEQHEGHVLEYQEWSSKTGLAGIIIKCKTCGKQRPMQGALSPDSLKGIKNCTGSRPWLFKGKGKREITESCDKPLQAVQKAASNVYLPVVRNSIFVPKQDDMPPEIANFINNTVYVDTLKSVTDKEMAITLIGKLGLVDAADAAIIYGLLNETGNDDQIKYSDIKEEEYVAFKKGHVKRNQDFDCTPQDIKNYQSWFSKYFANVSLIDKLRDTRAYVGFTRVKPFDEYDRSVHDLIKQVSPTGELPVDVVRGEGIFLEFDHKAIEKWRNLKGVADRMKKLPAQKLELLAKGYEDPCVFMLLHTFAHIVINELCLVAGYNSSSIKERIYATAVDGAPMNGVLIYTNSGDSEGSLGGLVRNGKPGALEPLIQLALQKADWCSSDPVCSEIIPQGSEGANLAACHNCCLLPETACEHMNLNLDRGLLRGSLSDSSFGYFLTSTL